MSPLARRYVSDHTKGTSPSVQKINQRDLLKMPFPADLSLDEQEAWVKYFDLIFDGVDRLEAQIREQYRDLQELVPSILDKAFRGEL
jgi:type I restriction enzyme S subunit